MRTAVPALVALCAVAACGSPAKPPADRAAARPPAAAPHSTRVKQKAPAPTSKTKPAATKQAKEPAPKKSAPKKSAPKKPAPRDTTSPPPNPLMHGTP